MIFQCETTKVHDQSGGLSMIAVHWTEARRGIESVINFVSVSAFIVGAISGVIGLIQSSGWLVALGLACLVLGYSLIRCAIEFSGRPREMQFHRGGTIVTPLGTAITPRHRAAWRAKHGDIVNVEAEQLERPAPDEINEYTHGVRLILRNGKVVHIAKYLMPDDAHQLAVQLTAAVAEIRLDIGSQMRGQNHRHEVYID